MKPLAIILIALLMGTAAFAQGEAAPIVEKEFDYRSWTFPSLADNSPLELRSMIAGKKLVMVVYFAPWCPNWKHDAPFVKRLKEKYGPRGLEIIGVGEYAPVESMRASLESFKLTIPAVYESTARTDVTKTTHYEARRKAGDSRGWGSPWYIFIEPDKVEPKGDVLTRKASVVNGELIEAEVEAFIERRLATAKSKRPVSKVVDMIDKCDPTVAELKGP